MRDEQEKTKVKSPTRKTDVRATWPSWDVVTIYDYGFPF